MAPVTLTPANSEASGSESSNEPGPKFCPWSGPPEENIILVQSNEIHLVPLLNQKCRQKFEVTAQDTLDGFPGKRLTDDIILFSSRAGVIFGRIPNSLSDDGVTKWLYSCIEYISSDEEAAWWHNEHSGPWACFVFVPMNITRNKWIYSYQTRGDDSRPKKILGMLDTYAEEKPWTLQLPGWGYPESRVGEIFGKCYIPRQRKRRRDSRKREDEEQSEESRPTRVSFVWDPEDQSREVTLRDEVWKDELLLERVEMSLI